MPDPKRSAAAWGVVAIDGLIGEAVVALGLLQAAAARGTVPAEVVHRVRTSLRRVDAAVRAYRPLLGDQDTEAMRTLIRPLRKRAGGCRDCDVGLVLVAEWRRKGVACPGLAGWLRKERAAAVMRVREAGAARLGSRLTERWHAVRGRLEATGRDRPAGVFAERRLRRSSRHARERLKRAVKALKENRDGAPAFEPVHRLRLGIKGARYRVEMFAPAIARKRGERLGELLEAAQKDLGKAVDAWVLSGLAGRFGRPAAAARRKSVAQFRTWALRVATKRAEKGIRKAGRALQRSRWSF